MRKKLLEAFLDAPVPQIPKVGSSGTFENLVWSDEFDTLDPTKWKHEITMAGGAAARNAKTAAHEFARPAPLFNESASRFSLCRAQVRLFKLLVS